MKGDEDRFRGAGMGGYLNKLRMAARLVHADDPSLELRLPNGRTVGASTGPVLAHRYGSNAH
jgi:hypothetical protein